MTDFYSLINENGEMVLSTITSSPETYDMTQWPSDYRLLKDNSPKEGSDFDPLLYYCERVNITPPDATEIQYELKKRATQLIISDVKSRRDMQIANIMWRIERYNRLDRLGLPQIDDIQKIDNYVQQLCDVPTQPGYPENVIWPSYPD